MPIVTASSSNCKMQNKKTGWNKAGKEFKKKGEVQKQAKKAERIP